MNRTTEQALGSLLLIGVTLLAFTVIMLRSGYKGKRVEGPVLAAVTGYVFYVAAALIADAKMPEFLREHLFDGLAPAAVVGLLVNSIPREHPRAALPWIRRPVMILVVLFAGGALIFGLIAAAAVFTSGSGGFAQPVRICALLGGILFAAAYWAAVGEDVDVSDRWRGRVEWWFRKRPKGAAPPEPGGPGGARSAR